MGIPTSDIDLSGPFTAEEAAYINQRKRLRNEVVANGNGHLLLKENFVEEFDDETGDETGDTTTSNSDPDNSGQSQGEPDNGAPDENENEDESSVFDNAPDYHDMNKDPLLEFVAELNAKLAEANESIEDEDERWELLPTSGTKDEIVAAIDALKAEAEAQAGEGE